MTEFHSDKVTIKPVSDEVLLEVVTLKTMLSVDEANEFVNGLIGASATAQGLDPDENDWIRIPMQYLVVELESENGKERCVVHCWVKFQTRKNARYVAFGHISEDGWQIHSVRQQCTVTGRDYSDGQWGSEFYNQAKLDGTVFVFEES